MYAGIPIIRVINERSKLTGTGSYKLRHDDKYLEQVVRPI